MNLRIVLFIEFKATKLYRNGTAYTREFHSLRYAIAKSCYGSLLMLGEEDKDILIMSLSWLGNTCLYRICPCKSSVS